MLESFLEMTAWKMTPPPAYGVFHLTFFLGGLAVAILLAYLLRKTNEKQNRAVLLTVGIFLVVCELYKQLFYYFYIGNHSYQWWIFPFQLCSIPMYFCLITPFLKEGRLRQSLYNFMLAFNLMGAFVAFLEPSGLVHEYWTLTIHAFIWHLALIFVGLYLGFSGRAGINRGGYRQAVTVLLVLSVIALSINFIFKDISGNTINMFFIGPANSSIIVFKDIAARYGWYVNAPIYLAALCIGGLIFYAPFNFASRKSRRAANDPA